MVNAPEPPGDEEQFRFACEKGKMRSLPLFLWAVFHGGCFRKNAPGKFPGIRRREILREKCPGEKFQEKLWMNGNDRSSG